jgi:hypothetical protein
VASQSLALIYVHLRHTGLKLTNSRRHVVEAAGLHQDLSNVSIVPSLAPEMGSSKVEARRRIFWVAWSLNKTLSYEYGWSPVSLPNMTVQSINTVNESGTDQYVILASMLPSDDLDVHDAESAQDLHKSLTTINALEAHSNEIKLLKADLAFCIYRRMRLSKCTSASISSAVTSLVIQIGLDALSARSDLAIQHLPWWFVISMPFQFLCVLLAIDSRKSLFHVAEAFEVSLPKVHIRPLYERMHAIQVAD